jgi:DNA-binding GntR family transcriptional regulator
LEPAEQIDAPAVRRRRHRRRTTPTPARMRFEAIHAEIRERICLLHYPPGHTLSEAELAREFGISRTPIRRVLQRLEYEGLVESRHGIGTIVTLVDRQALTEIDSLRMKLAEISGEMTLLPLEDGIGRLERLFDRCGELRTRVDVDEFGRINIAVQQEVSRSIGNVPLREVSDRLFFQTSRMWLQLLPRMDWAEEVAAFSSEITDLLQAAEMNDLPSLHFARRNHISMNRARMKGYFGK